MMNPEIAQMMSLEGKVAIVTGGAMGIGQGITLRLAQVRRKRGDRGCQ